MQSPISNARTPLGGRRTAYLLAVTALAALLSSGTSAAASKAPTEALQAATLAIASADHARVAEYAAPELNDARSKLAAANVAVEREQMTQARYLAEESLVTTQLASAKAEAVKAAAVNDELLKSTEDLKQEMKRNPGAR